MLWECAHQPHCAGDAFEDQTHLEAIGKECVLWRRKLPRRCSCRHLTQALSQVSECTGFHRPFRQCEQVIPDGLECEIDHFTSAEVVVVGGHFDFFGIQGYPWPSYMQRDGAKRLTKAVLWSALP